MPDDDKLTPDPRDAEIALSLALMTSGRAMERSQSAEIMAEVVAERFVASLKRSGFLVMRKPITGGSAPLNPPPSWPHLKPEDLRLLVISAARPISPTWVRIAISQAAFDAIVAALPFGRASARSGLSCFWRVS
jgi:hypothetical protein